MLVVRPGTTPNPIVLFGAFDRHNFGDLLFPHVAAALLGNDNLLFAGLAERDLRHYGGHRVDAIATLAAQWRDRPVNILHVGGEILSCDAWPAAVMLLSAEDAQKTIARLGGEPEERLQWAQDMMGLDALAPYTVGRELFPRAFKLVYNAVGGVDLDKMEAALRTEVLDKLRASGRVSVRDKRTQSTLRTAGVLADLVPDPAVMTAELFSARIRACARRGEVAQCVHAFPQGYVAVQFSADFGDDETLSRLAAELDRVVEACGFGVVFFRAGAAPWHDDLRCYRDVTSRMRSGSVKVFASLDLWEICSLLAHCRVSVGSSLHGRILAMAFALPRINLLHPAHGAGLIKQAAYADTWEVEGMPTVVEVQDLADAFAQAIAVDADALRRCAHKLAVRYRHAFDTVRAELA